MERLTRSDVILEQLPDGRALLDEGKRIGAEVSTGLSLLCETHGVRSEVAYRRKMMAENRLMTCMNIGLHSWAETARALETIHRECEGAGFRIDRYQLNLDRRMGLPRSLWNAVPRETGPLLESDADWHATARTVPIQPHLGDMMIGSPMSLRNARSAIEAGVTYIGNLSQFAWQYPMWDGGDVEQVAQTVKALGLMAAKREDDLVVHSYLDDGFAAQFTDYCSYIGWSMLEHYIVDEVAGARLANAYGGLTHDPITKMAMIVTLEAIKPPDTLNPFYHGNTTAYSKHIDSNFARLSLDVLYIMLAQLRTGSGAPSLPIPVTEALRIPSADEIVQAHCVARGIAERAESLIRIMDWLPVDELSERLLAGGQRFYNNVMQGLEDIGLDLADPMELLLALRRIGGAEIERRFGAGERLSIGERGREPVIPTDTYRDFLQQRDATRAAVAVRAPRLPRTLTLVVGSTDVHEYAMLLVIDALQTLGVEPIVAGTSVDPRGFAAIAHEHRAHGILVSTHNGMALTYAQSLRAALIERDLSVPIAIGGVLNEDLGDGETPVDLLSELRQLGLTVCADASDVAAFLETL